MTKPLLNGNQKQTNGIKLTDFLDINNILCHTELHGKEEVVRELLKRIKQKHNIGNIEEVMETLLDTEKLEASFLLCGISIPHGRFPLLEKLVIAIATSQQGIVFSDDVVNPLVRLVVLILAPKDEPALYLEVLSLLSKICLEHDNIVEEIVALPNAESIWKFLDRGGIVLPNYVCAGDIMVKNPVVLKETDTLGKAIDLFVKHNLIDLPVVDNQNELVGRVSAYELLRVCLPDYILWMEDLSPILNFEPFANILRNENSTSLADIMSSHYTEVEEDVPAIDVAKEIARQHSRQVYVVRNKKLVGVITLQHFLYKILRG